MAAAAGAEECLFLDFYSRGSEVTLGTFGVRFGRVFGTKIGWCFGSGSSGWRRRFFSRDSEITLGGVRLGRVFGTKLQGVLVRRGRVARG